MIYNRLAVVRTEANMSRKELAGKVDVNHQTIGFIERGDYQPSLELAFKLAKVLGTDVVTLFSDKPIQPMFRSAEKAHRND